MNDIYRLLGRVVDTGELPTAEQVSATLHKGSRSDRNAAAGELVTRAKMVRNRLNRGGDDLAQDLETLKVDAAEQLAHVAGWDEGAQELLTSRRLADDIHAARSQGGSSVEDRLQGARTAAARRAPLTELLRRGARIGGVHGADLDDLPVREGMTADERTAWRGRVSAASRRVSEVYRSGNTGESYQLAAELAAGLDNGLAEVVTDDRPNAHVDDGRELARLIRQRSGNMSAQMLD